MEHTEQLEVWMGLLTVIPRVGCTALAGEEGAYVHVLTLAASEPEYRTKVVSAMSYYCLDLLEVRNVTPFSHSTTLSEEIILIAHELETSRNPEHVRFVTFHTFPRTM